MELALAAICLAPLPLLAQATPRWLLTDHLGCLTPPQALAAVGLAGTDLGVSFPCGERIVFLFGDSWTADRAEWDVDSAAWLRREPLPAAAVPPLQWHVRPGGRFLPLAPRGALLPGMDVPVEGIAVGDRTYVFFSSGWSEQTRAHSHSVLARANGHDLARLEPVHRVATTRFVNVSIVVDGGTAWIFGTGAYRLSSVFLAHVPVATLADRAAWRYWPGDGGDEAAAQPLVASDCLGELSVRRLPDGGPWVMTANANAPRGIHLRLAPAPAGPWSDPVVIFEPRRDRGYGYTMHQATAATGFDDGLSEPGRDDVWGGEYGPYLVPEWCSSPAPGVHAVVYTLSTWNPYTVRLVRSVIATGDAKWSPPAPPAPRESSARPPRNLDFAGGKLDGWQQEGDAFATARRADGTFLLTTWVAPHGDRVRGRLWQDFVVPASARELRAFVHGGTEAVQLWRSGELLRSTRGRRTNHVETALRWSIDDLRGQAVRLVIADDSTAPWGFVSVRGLQLVE